MPRQGSVKCRTGVVFVDAALRSVEPWEGKDRDGWWKDSPNCLCSGRIRAERERLWKFDDIRGASSASSAISSVASGASSAASSAIEPSGEAEGTLASECGAIDAIMSGEPDADPAGTAAKLEEIKAKISTPDAELVGHLAEAYQGAAANPHDPALHEQVQSSATELGQACHSATTSAKPN